jgi:hypothetical protein
MLVYKDDMSAFPSRIILIFFDMNSLESFQVGSIPGSIQPVSEPLPSGPEEIFRINSSCLVQDLSLINLNIRGSEMMALTCSFNG